VCVWYRISSDIYSRLFVTKYAMSNWACPCAVSFHFRVRVSFQFNKSLCSASHVSCKRGAAHICCCGAGHATIGLYLLPAGPTYPPHAAAAGEWNRQTDGRTPYRYIDRILCGQHQENIARFSTTVKRHRPIHVHVDSVFSLYDDYIVLTLTFMRGTCTFYISS